MRHHAPGAASSLRHHGAGLGRRMRRGMTLIEVMVAIVIILAVTAVMVPQLSTALMLQQRAAAREVALVYEQLHDDAILRNKTFRVAFNVTKGSWHVESGDPNALIFSNPEAREVFEERQDEMLEKMEPEERKAYQARQAFQKVDDGSYGGVFQLPKGTRFGSVYTPQYEEAVTPGRDDDDKKGPRMAYSYVFANGFSEYTVVQIVDEEDPDEGFTITVDPLSGRVVFHSELVDRHDAWSFLPEEGPRLDF